MELTFEDMEDLARGAAFLGAGGGGDPHSGRLLAQHAIKSFGAPKLLALEDLKDDDVVFSVGAMGAPTVLIEKLMGGPEAELGLERLERYTGRTATVILPAEAGGMNSLMPVKMAAARGLPCVDADGMGRAFPEIQMVTFNVYGIQASPLAISNEHGEVHIIEARDSKTAEDMARQVVARMGASVSLACYPMTGADAKRTAVPSTLSLAIGIGKAIAEGRRRGDPFTSLTSYLRSTEYYCHCRELYRGKIEDILRETTGGFSVGKCRIAGFKKGEVPVEITFQNENLVAHQGGRTLAIVPDLICILDQESAEPITTETLRYGQRVRVIGASVAPIMRTPESLNVFGPRAFGLDEDFQPIESLIPSPHPGATQ